MKYNDFLKECNDRQVFKKLSIYIVASWIILQVLSVISDPVGLPKKSLTIGLILLLIGFPIYAYYIWKTHLVHLELNEQFIDDDGNVIDIKQPKSPFQKIFFSILSFISLIVAFAVFTIVKNNFIDINTTSSKVKLFESVDGINKIAVLKFGNNTGDKELDIVGKMAADWIIHGITENQLGQVISPELVDDYSSVIKTSLIQNDENDILNDYLKPGKVILGNFYLNDGKLLFQGSIVEIVNGNNKTTSFKNVECSSNNPIDCIEELKEVILGYLVVEENRSDFTGEAPPTFEAYQYLLEAEAEDNFDNPDQHLEYLNKAIDLDPNYFEPQVLRIAHYYNETQFKIADSLRKSINISSSKNKRQKNLLNFYEALLEGNNKKVFDFLSKEYEITPFDISNNSSMLVVALQFVNRPNVVNEIFNQVSFNDVDIVDCIQCAYRIYIKARADVELKNYDEAIAILTKTIESSDYLDLKKTLAAAYIRSSQDEKLANVLANKFNFRMLESDLSELNMFIGKEYLLAGNLEKATLFFNKLLNNSDLSTLRKGKASYYNRDFAQAEKYFITSFKDEPTNIDLLVKIAISSIKLGNESQANEFLKKLESQRREYQFGSIDYAFAQYYSSIDDTEKTLEYLEKAVAAGYRFKDEAFQNDPHFISFIGSIEFNNILNFWN